MPSLSPASETAALRRPARPQRVRAVGWLVCLGGLLALHGPAAAGDASPAAAVLAPPPAAAAVLRLRGFTVTGDNPLDEASTRRSLAPFLNTELGLDTLQQAVAALEAALAAEGHALHRVVLPAQEVTDTLRLQVVRFAIGRVQLEGAEGVDEANIRWGLPELQTAQTPRLERLAIQTALSNENPAKRVQVVLKPSSEQPDQIDATVRVQSSPPVRGVVSLSNTGNAASGNDRLSVSLSHANLGGLDHQLSVAWTGSLERWGDVRQWGLSYRLPLYNQGGMLDVGWSDSTVQGQFGSFTSTGAGRTAAVQFTQHHGTQAGWTRYTTLGLEEKVFVPSSVTPLGGGPVVYLSQRRLSRPLSLGLRLQQQGSQTYTDAQLVLVAALPGGAGHSVSAYQSENPRISSNRWRALRGSVSHVRQVGGAGLLSARLQGQWASTALLAGEQFGLGGVGHLRGTAERVLSADSGASAGLELTRPAWAEGLRAAAFVDAGWLRQRRVGLEAKPAHDAAVSLGVGLRYASGPVMWVADYARVVNGSSQAGTAAAKGQDRWHVLLGTRF